MNKMKKMVIMLCVALVTMLLIATTAFAQTIVTTEEELSTALQTGGEVALGNDIVVNVALEIPESVEVTLDLAGHKINGNFNGSSTTNHIYVLNNYGTLTVEDSGENGAIVSRGVYNYGALILNGGTIEACDGNGGYAINNKSGSTFTMNGGAVVVSYDDDPTTFETADATAIDVCTGNVTTINGGKVTSVANWTYSIVVSGGKLNVTNKNGDANISGAHGALSVLNGTAVIDGGTFACTGVTNQTDNVIYVDGDGTLTINDGTFVADGDTASGGCCVSDSVGGVEITGGDFSNSSGGDVYGTTGTTITGGTFENLTETSHVTNGSIITNNGETVVKTENGTVAIDEVVSMVNGVAYTTFDEALTAASTLTGDVVVEIYNKVTLSTSLSGSYDSIKFVGKSANAEIYLDVQGYITASGKKVAFDSLTLSKSVGGYITDAGFMNVAFGVYNVVSVDYTNCTFTNGAYASSGVVTFDGCTFYRSHEKYGLWAYGDADITIENCKFDDYRGIKMYAEGAATVTDLTVINTDFSAVNDKPAIVLTCGQSVTISGNTYSSTGVFELDNAYIDSVNGCEIKADITDISCMNDDYADCGVIVDGKIYVTLTDAVEAEAVTGDSTVTLMYNSTEEIELPEGTTLDKNGYTADSVTVAEVKPKGTLSSAYTSSNTIWGECGGNAYEKFELKIYSGDTYMGYTSLNNIGGIIDGDVYVSWHIKLDAEANADEYWTMYWEVAPSINVQPTRVEQWIDGVKVAECAIELNGPDDLNKIYAAEVDENGIIVEYCTLDSFVSKISDLKDRRILVLKDVEFTSESITCVELISGVEGGVTIIDTDYENWIDFDFVTVGHGVTVSVVNPYSSDSENVIIGTLNVTGTYYHGYDAKTTIKDGGKVTVVGTTILRYNQNSDSGIYIYGDGDDTTVEFDCDYYIGAYSATFYAENANIEAGYVLFKNSYDPSEYSDAKMTLNGSKLVVTGTNDGQNSFFIDDQASLTLSNEASISGVRDFNILEGTNLTLSIDENSTISATNVSIAQGVPFEATKNEDGTYSVAVKIYTLDDVFVFLGYSKSEIDNSITAGFTVDHEALANYKAQNNNVSVEFGAVYAIDSIANGSYEKSLSVYKATSNYNVIVTNVTEADTTVVLSMYVKVGNEKYYVAENTVVTDPSQVAGTTFNTAPKKEEE